MASYIRVVDFLPANTELMAWVKPPPDLDPELKKLLRTDVKNFPYRSDARAAPIYLEETLRIKFSISERWNIERDLQPCTCTTPVLPNRKLRSVNSIYQAISEVVEPHRTSRGGKVYDRIYFQDPEDGLWKRLEVRRDQVYEPFKSDYEEKVSVYTQRTPAYVKSHPAADQFYEAILMQQDELLAALKLENQDLLAQVQRLNAIFQESRLAVYKEKIEEFKSRLRLDLPETQGDDSWQSWIYRNNWLFASQYGTPMPKERVGFDNIPDFLFPTLDGFIDVLEIKRPTFDVVVDTSSHKGAYRWSREANEAIGQVVNYLHEIATHELEIVKRIEDKHSLKLSAIKPRGFILIGRSDGWAREKRIALRTMNHSLHDIEVLTYTDLLRRGESLIELYEDSDLRLSSDQPGQNSAL